MTKNKYVLKESVKRSVLRNGKLLSELASDLSTNIEGVISMINRDSKSIMHVECIRKINSHLNLSSINDGYKKVLN